MSTATRVARRVVPVALLVVLGPGTLPAGAIKCGKADPAVKALTIAPAGLGWRATAEIVDLDSATR